MAKKMCFSQFLRPKILKNKGPEVNFLFDFSKTILVLLESNKKSGLSHLFFEIGAAKVTFSSRKNTFYGEKNTVASLYNELVGTEKFIRYMESS